MGKKSTAWQTLPRPTTAKDTRAYIDACVDWLLEIQPPDDDDELFTHQLPVDLAPQPVANLGVVESELHGHAQYECFVCGAPDTGARATMANPFTRSNYMLLCANCRHA